MGSTRKPLHFTSSAGIVAAVTGAFFGGLIAASALIANDFSVKREIDLVEVSKISFLAIAALLFRRHQERRDRTRQSEREHLLIVIDDATKYAAVVNDLFRTAEIGDRGAITGPWREKLVVAFDTLDTQISLLERMLYDCNCSSNDDAFLSATENYNDVVLRNGLNAPITSRPQVGAAYQTLHLALWRVRLRVVRL